MRSAGVNMLLYLSSLYLVGTLFQLTQHLPDFSVPLQMLRGLFCNFVSLSLRTWSRRSSQVGLGAVWERPTSWLQVSMALEHVARLVRSETSRRVTPASEETSPYHVMSPSDLRSTCRTRRSETTSPTAGEGSAAGKACVLARLMARMVATWMENNIVSGKDRGVGGKADFESVVGLRRLMY
jgi:hypothetical protein